MMNHRKHPERIGMALVAMVLLITSVFVLMTAGAGELLNTSLRQASRSHSNRRTGYCAYAIMQRALDQLSTNLLYSVDPKETGVWAADPELTYELSIYNNYAGTFANPAPDGKYVPPYMVYIKVKADYRDYPGRFTSTLFSKAYVGGQASNFAIVGTDQVTINNSVVDAWFVKKTGATYTLAPSAGGRVVTNAVQANKMMIYGTSNVDANVYWGPYGPPTVLNLSAPAVINPARTQAAAPSPTRVPRFHPPSRPNPAAPDIVVGSTTSLPPGSYKSLTVTGPGTTLHLASGEYYFANNVTITNSTVDVPGVTAVAPCDVYVGKTITATNSTINWANTLKRVAPDPPLTDGELAAQALLGPRTFRVFFVGSGAPNFKDCEFTADNCKMSLHACGKAMQVDLLNGSILWGGLKGFNINLQNSELHYQRVAQDT